MNRVYKTNPKSREASIYGEYRVLGEIFQTLTRILIKIILVFLIHILDFCPFLGEKFAKR